ncbi:MAG: hypothetical protein KJ063_17315 [Anaerolineae bacterium]|nr:hypothetical protein [Anaerolineae bacterium]
MTQKPPPRRTSSTSGQTNPSKKSNPSPQPSRATSSSRSSSSTSANPQLPNLSNLSKLKLPGGGFSTGCLVIVGLIALCLIGGFLALNFNELLGDDPATRAPITPGSTRVTGGQPPGSGPADWYQIYFTEATCPSVGNQIGGLDEIIADTIRQAQVSVDMAIYELNSQPITDALISARRRNVPVRVVIDSDYEDKPSIAQLRQNGITVVTDSRTAFMHNKFTIIDGRYVWTGSMNYMPNDIFCNNNNLVWFDSTQLAANYTAEMNEMFVEGNFGPRSPVNTPFEQFTHNGVMIENYFSPETRVAPIIGELVRQAQNEILFLAFSFTHEDVGEAMLERAEAGVRVQGVFERTGSEQPFSYFSIMREENLPTIQIRQDGNPRTMHHKVIILDRQTVIFGSFNFSANANNSNDENTVVVHDATFANFFVEEFFRVWDAARQ